MSLFRTLLVDPSSMGAGERPEEIMILHKSARTPASDAEIKFVHKGVAIVYEEIKIIHEANPP